jgi:dihydrodipicolinate synthase/N-acetylneuraminate lyase
MQTVSLRPSDFSSSVVAVPPIALTRDLKVACEPNRTLLTHIERGGVKIVLFGGNANLYNYSLGSYQEALDMMCEMPAAATHVIASIGPDFGKALDQAPLVQRSGIPNVMLLPMAFPSDSHGVGDGVRRIVEQLGRPVILYIKRDGYLKPITVKRLVDEGAVWFCKYAVERPDPANDPYLDSLIAEVGKDLFASGMGENPIADHIGNRHLKTFTSGAVCVAPRAAMQLLELYGNGSFTDAAALAAPFLAFERVRTEFGGIQVLHEGITLSGIADMGLQMPMVSRLKAHMVEPVREAVAGLMAAESSCAG